MAQATFINLTTNYLTYKLREIHCESNHPAHQATREPHTWTDQVKSTSHCSQGNDSPGRHLVCCQRVFKLLLDLLVCQELLTDGIVFEGHQAGRVLVWLLEMAERWDEDKIVGKEIYLWDISTNHISLWLWAYQGFKMVMHTGNINTIRFLCFNTHVLSICVYVCVSQSQCRTQRTSTKECKCMPQLMMLLLL